MFQSSVHIIELLQEMKTGMKLWKTLPIDWGSLKFLFSSQSAGHAHYCSYGVTVYPSFCCLAQLCKTDLLSGDLWGKLCLVFTLRPRMCISSRVNVLSYVVKVKHGKEKQSK